MPVALTKRSSKKRTPQAGTKPLFVCSRDPNHKTQNIAIPDSFPEGLIGPREYQEIAVKHICDRYANGYPLSGLILSTGAGKSKTASIAISQILTDNPKVRAIIAIPQEVIGDAWRHNGNDEDSHFLIGEENWSFYKGLSEEKKKNWKNIFDDKKAIRWGLALDLCESAGKACISEDGKVKEVIKFLEDPAGVSVHSRIILVTHATLARVYKELKKANKRHLLSKLIMVIDEFHHLFVSSSEETCNTLGEMVFYVLENRQLQTHICGLTATFFRGDRRRIFAGKFADILDNAFYELPFDEYFPHFRYLNKLIYDFGVFSAKEAFIKPIASAVRKHGLSKSIFFIPARTKGEDSAFPVSRKKNDVENVLLGILEGVGWKKDIEKRTYTDNQGERVDGVFQLRIGENKWITVVDAVDDEDHIRKGVKKFLKSVNKGKDSVDVIIALGMCKEGFDWVACDRIVLIGNVKSLAMIVQINGRMIRDVAGKSYSVMTWLLPTTSRIDSKSVSEDLNQALLSLNLALMMCIDVMQPIMVMAPKRNNPEEQEEISGGDLMSELFETTDRRNQFLAMVTAKIAKEGKISFGYFEDEINITDRMPGFGFLAVRTYY
jgi:superfamily II DNA or RNA helicase